MRAVGEPLIVEDVELAPPDGDEVLIRVAASGLCHSDLHFVEGWYPIKLPAVLGHEAAGVVEAVGENVTYVAPGDHVITYLTTSCGVCTYCVEGRTHLCEDRDFAQRDRDEPARITQDGVALTQFLNLGSFAGGMLVHQGALVKIAREIPLDKAALLGCGVTTGLGAVFNTARVTKGQTVAVVGCGGVGLASVQGAAIAGASRIIAVDLVDEKLNLARLLGATDTVNGSTDDPLSRVLEMTDGRGVHHALEANGAKRTVEMAFKMLRRGGVATVIGLLPEGAIVEIAGDQLYYEKAIQGSNMGSSNFRRDIPGYIDWYLEGRLNLDDMVTRRLPLDSINEGFDDMRKGLSARSILVFD